MIGPGSYEFHLSNDVGKQLIDIYVPCLHQVVIAQCVNVENIASRIEYFCSRYCITSWFWFNLQDTFIKKIQVCGSLKSKREPHLALLRIRGRNHRRTYTYQKKLPWSPKARPRNCQTRDKRGTHRAPKYKIQKPSRMRSNRLSKSLSPQTSRCHHSWTNTPPNPTNQV